MNTAFFTKSWPRHNHNSSLQRTISLIQSLINNNHKIAVCSTQQNLAIKQPLSQYPMQLIDININKIGNSLNQFTKLKFKPGLFIFDSVQSQEMYSGFLYNRWNKVSRVLMINQIKGLQKWRRNNYKLLPNVIIPNNAPMAPNTIQQLLTTQQLRSISRCDHIFTANSYVYYLLATHLFKPKSDTSNSSIFNNKYISQINYGFPLQQFYAECDQLMYRPFKNRNNFVFLGNFQQGKQSNYDAVFLLVSFIWPIIRQKLGNQVQLHIYGTCGTGGVRYETAFESMPKTQNLSKQNLKKQGIHFKGIMQQPQQLSQYNSLLYPCTFSTGSHMKVIQSWFMHLPVVTTPIGAQGLFLQNYNPQLAAGAQGNVFTAERIYSDQEKKQSQSVKNYYVKRVLEKQEGEGIFTFGGSYNNFSYKDFVESAVKMYTNEQYWNKCLQNSHKIIKRNQNQQHNQGILKKSLVNVQIATYEGRTRTSYEEQWKRYTRSHQFNKKLRN